jgi:NitT/TauT family transport system ATP-binding protein
MAATPFVELRHVNKRFGDGPPVLDRVSLDAQAGDFVSLLGPSGCGKSTLLRLIAGLSPLSGGTLTVDGRTPAEAAAELAFVFQDPTLLPWLTVARNIEIPQRLRGAPATARIATCRRVLALVRLAEKARAYPRQLSGGQKMRVSLARALSLSPRLLLLDEPFGALDVQTRELMQDELLGLWAGTGAAVVFVTHDLTEAISLADRVVVMTAGPATVKDVVTIDLPRPRKVEEIRLTPEFTEIYRNVWDSLREEVEITRARGAADVA